LPLRISHGRYRPMAGTISQTWDLVRMEKPETAQP
jgi:hypothetical protein